MSTRRPSLIVPPREYDPQYLIRLLSQLDKYFLTVDNPGDAVVNTLRILQPPNSGFNLPVGSVWVEDGFLKIVVAGVVYVDSIVATGEIGTVTVSV